MSYVMRAAVGIFLALSLFVFNASAQSSKKHAADSGDHIV